MFRRPMTVVAAVVLLVTTFAPGAVAARGPRGAEVTYHVKVHMSGAAIHGANGLAFDADGRLLVASAFGGEIVVLDSQTGAVLARLGHEAGVDSPDDVAVAPDGTIYWTDLPVGEVGRRAPDGTVTKQFIAVGVNPVTVSDDGRVFVAQAFLGNGLYELDPLLADPPRVVIADTFPLGMEAQLNGFDVGTDGMLYAPQPFLQRVVRVDPDHGTITPVAEGLPAPPSSVELDSQGRLYASTVTGSVLRIDPATAAFEVAADIPGAILDNLAIDGQDRVFASGSHNGAVYALAPGGGVRTLTPGGLILPGGLALVPGQANQETLFVADFWNLVEADARSGRILDVDSGDVTGAGVAAPWTVAADGANVIISSWFSRVVQIWDPAADEAVATYTEFPLPMNAIRFQGDVVVAELSTGSVLRRDATGAVVPIATGLAYPAGLAATDDDLWVADWWTGTVWQIVAGGTVLPSPHLVASGLRFPEGMAVDRDGSLLVVEAVAPGNGRLTRIDPMTGVLTTVAEGLDTGALGSRVQPPSFALASVAVSSTGTLYVTGDRGNVVYRLHPVPAG